MDEQTLCDISLALECPVCFNTLNENNRVLPCQHTFCMGCLEDIYAKRNELICPECRTIVNCCIRDLPRNILLVRLLDVIHSRRNSTSEGSLLTVNGARSCPTSPAYTSAGSSFPLLFPRPTKESLLREDLGHPAGRLGHVPIDAAGSRTTMPTFRSPSDTQSISAATRHGSFGASTRVASGMRLSRTTIDLTSVAAQLETSAKPELEIPSVALDIAPPSLPLPPGSIISTGEVFSQSGWRSSPRNRSLPSNKEPTNYSYRWVGRTGASTVERAANRKYPNVVVATGVTEEPSSQFVEISYPNVPQSRNRTNQGVGASEAFTRPKENTSFINKLFRSYSKTHEFHPNAVSDRLKNLSVAESGMIDNVLDDNKNTKVVELNAFRQTRSVTKPTTFECYRCVAAYSARNHYELDLRTNDLLYVHQKHSDGWMRATHERTGRNGLIPTAFVERLHGSVTSA